MTYTDDPTDVDESFLDELDEFVAQVADETAGEISRRGCFQRILILAFIAIIVAGLLYAGLTLTSSDDDGDEDEARVTATTESDENDVGATVTPNSNQNQDRGTTTIEDDQEDQPQATAMSPSETIAAVDTWLQTMGEVAAAYQEQLFGEMLDCEAVSNDEQFAIPEVPEINIGAEGELSETLTELSTMVDNINQNLLETERRMAVFCGDEPTPQPNENWGQFSPLPRVEEVLVDIDAARDLVTEAQEG